MKKFIKNIALSAIGLMVIASISVAQEKPTEEKKKQASALNLNDEQKAVMKANTEAGKARKAALEATYTAEQKAIAENKDLQPMERRKALEATFTAEQKALAAKNREESKAAQEKFRSSLSDEQKEQLKARSAGRGAGK